MKIQVLRLNSSSYQNKEFKRIEKETLNQLQNVQFVDSVSSLVPDANYILITNTHTEVEKIAPNILERTALIVHPNSGHDNIPPQFIKEMKFPIIRGNKIRANAVAEYSLSAIFKHFTPLKNHLFWDKSRVWDRQSLKDQDVLILGNGHIGSIIYKSLSPLVQSIKVVEPQQNIKNIDSNILTSYDNETFKSIDILIIAANLNESTHGLINSKVLDQLSDDVLIINPARGPIIVQQDLQRHLEMNPKSFAYLDVFNQEPFLPSDFKDLKNINKTSHIAGVYKDLNKDIIKFEKEVIKSFLEDTDSFLEAYKQDILR